MDHGTTWARVENNRTGETGWLNLQTEEVITDDQFASLVEAGERGVIVGDPLKSGEWLSAEKCALDLLGVGVE